MPLYAYQCRECGHDLEVRQSFSDSPLTECPNCGAPTGLFRVVQPTGIVFKGSGFYVTDSGKKNGAAMPANGKNGKTESTDTKTESTPSEGAKTDTAKTETPAPKAEKASDSAA